MDDAFDVINSDSKSEEEHKIDELININGYIIERDVEKESINNNNINNDLRSNCNIFSGEKLIKPILIWWILILFSKLKIVIYF